MFISWIVIYQLPDKNLHLIACDVGQGDAILAVYKNIQFLIDGGPPNGMVEKCLSEHMPFWDRQLELVVNTHPQVDHFGGLINIFKNYKVDTFIKNDLSVSTPEYKALLKQVGANSIRVITLDNAPRVVGGLIQYDIFYPSAEVLSRVVPTNNEDVNDYSIQGVLKFGEFKALLTGDIGSNKSDEVLSNFSNESVNYIKIPHHGSKNGMTADYLRRIMPEVAVISVGKKNTFGHPSKEVLDLLKEKGIKTFRTDEIGDVEIVSDGVKFWIRTK